VINRPLVEADLSAVRALHDDVFGPGRFARTAYRVREGTADISPFCLGAFAGPDLVAALRMTEIAIGRSRPDLLLGPLAVARAHAGQGFGKALVADGLKAAERAGIGVVVLVGDLGYYQRFGFAPVPSAQIIFPGPVDPRRILAVELRPGALVSARGLVTS
jgi:predicted N-acetyltransferase YhbS